MITLRRGDERRQDPEGRQEAWVTFHPQDRTGPLVDGFGVLERLEERRLPPGGALRRHRHREAEVVTYVREGALAYEDSPGHSGVIQAGEFERQTAGSRHRETNASQTDATHLFRIWLHPWEAGLAPSREQRRFSVAQRHGGLCLVVSPDARKGSLRIHQDVLVYSALLDPGQHVIHELPSGRRAWLHLVEGEATLGELLLTAGDGAGVEAERAVSFTVRERAEVLLLDLVEPPPRPGRALRPEGHLDGMLP